MNKKAPRLPSNVLAAIRVTSKCGFLSRRIWNEHLSHGHRSWRFRQWKSLIDDGYFCGCREFGFANDAIILSRKGITTAMNLGMDPVGTPGAKNLWHDDDLISMALSLERHGLISQWTTESELKLGRMTDLFRFHETDQISKFPDLVVQLKHPTDVVLWAVELERSQKEHTRYYDLIQAYAGASRLDAVLVIAATASIEKNIKHAMNRLAYPQQKRPMLFASYQDFLANPGGSELRMGEKRSSIATAVNRWRDLESRNMKGNDVALDAPQTSASKLMASS